MRIGLGLGLGLARSFPTAQVLPAWVTTDNLFTSPQDLSTGWTRNNLAAHSTTTGYAGETASVMTEAADTAVVHSVTQSISLTSGVTYIMRALVKAGSGVRLPQLFLPANRFTLGISGTFWVNGNGVFADGNDATPTITYLGDGHLLLSITKAATSTGSGTITFRLHNGTAVSYDGDGTSSIIVTALGLHVVP